MTHKSSVLSKKTCVPCREGAKPLIGSALEVLHSKLGGGWEIIDGHHLYKEFRFDRFKQAMAFVDQVATIAERENHHPDIHISYNRVKLLIWTHKIDGLTESDFILAAKFNEVPLL